MKRLAHSMLLFIFITLMNVYIYAGGPLNSFDGRAIVYQSSDFPVPYHPDRGDLGDFSNGQATDMVNTCFETWQDVATATIIFQNGGQLPVDVDSTNYGPYLDNFSDGINPIIFDSDGSIIDAEYGAGASNNIIGFAGSAYNTSTGYYVEGLAVLNGKFSTVFTYDQFKATFFHEFGHFLGLDHTQINLQYVHDGDTANDIYVPTMYPTATDDDTSLADPNPDDEAAITLLYPEPNVNTTYGKIEGTVKWGNEQPVLGANVVAVKIGDEDMSQFSSISDYYMQNNGEYEMYVIPGDYKLFIEPINRSFTGGSSVGPYAENLNQPSFTSPVTKEYYNGNDESDDEVDLDDFVVITVSAGETVSDIDFIAEGGTSSITTSSPLIHLTTTVGPTTTTTTATGTTTTSFSSTTSSTSSTTTSALFPNLYPCTPTGWPDPIVPSSKKGNNTIDGLIGGLPTYIDFAFCSEAADISESFYITLYIDGVEVGIWQVDEMLIDDVIIVEDFTTSITAGVHTIKIIVDSTDLIAETNENDNSLKFSFTWQPSWFSVYKIILEEDEEEKLLMLRRYRDEILVSNRLGKMYVNLLYEHSVEIASLLLGEEDLTTQAKGIISGLLPGLNSLREGGGMEIHAEMIMDMELLLEDIEVKASPTLRIFVRKLKKDIKNGNVFEQLGIYRSQ